MFGLTLGALKIYRQNEKMQRESYGDVARAHSVTFAFYIIIALLSQLYIPLLSHNLKGTLITLPIAALTTSLAYYHAGIVITLCLTRSPFPIGRVYGADLLGAGLGCICALIVMESIDTPSGVLLLAGLSSLAALLFPSSNSPDYKSFKLAKRNIAVKNAAILVCVLSFSLGIANILASPSFLYPIWVKGGLLMRKNFEYDKWNSISRVTVTPELVQYPPYLWGPSPVLPKEARSSFHQLVIDGDASTPLTHFNGNFSEYKYLEYDVTNIAYSLPNLHKAAIVGVGGGRDLLSAKYFGVDQVWAMDVNPVQINLLTKHPVYSKYTNLRDLPGVVITNNEARSWFRQNEIKMDLIEMSLIDTWAATGAGAFALSENGLYTVEAWTIFMNDLADNGVFTVSRWSSDAQNDAARTVSIAIASLFKQGIHDVKHHIALIGSARIVTLIVSKTPFTQEQISALRKTSDEKHFSYIIMPDAPAPTDLLGKILAVKDMQELLAVTGSEFFDYTPSTDMRPFFFNQAKFSNFIELFKMVYFQSADGGNGVAHGHAKATFYLLVIILFSVLMVGFVIIYPLLRTFDNKSSLFVKAGSLYFVLIGLGFMLIEISLLQALGVYLGHPIYGLSVVLFGLIISAGIGSFLSDRFPLTSLVRQSLWCLITCGYGVFLAMVLPSVFSAYAEVEIVSRILISLAIICPAGILMGFGFPTGLNLTEKFDTRATAWFWGVNGASGVLGSSIAIALNISIGIDKTLMVGSFCYALLLITFLSLSGKTKKDVGL